MNVNVEQGPLDCQFQYRELNVNVILFPPIVDFSINVLSSGSWPYSHGPPFVLSLEVRVYRYRVLYRGGTLEYPP